MTFDGRRTYQAALDVRNWESWQERLRGEPEGVLWALIGTRRSGKTWALKALMSPDRAYVSLQFAPDGLATEHKRACLLVDEPGKVLRRERLAFIARCAELKQAGVRVLLAMTPGDWEFLSELDPEQRYVDRRDCLTLPLLTEAQAERLARAAWARHLLPDLPRDWRRNPFLLELLFEAAEEGAAELREREQVDQLLRAAVRKSRTTQYRYVDWVFGEGLSERQRAEVRRVARGDGTDDATGLLHECGLVDEGPRIADPILADHFRSPLVIHHISDIHFGPKSAAGVDGKEKGLVSRICG